MPTAGEQESHMTTNGNDAGGLGHGYYLEDLSVGMEASYAKKITDEDVLAFAGLSGGVIAPEVLISATSFAE